ncbi:hypothetical protein [Romboutsia lituseburensis]|uniref:hypothetical protein n=1 Tax=Romboutsia lituseburensis TaxID=1537 RepID=UPI00215ADCCA|nr:hypothetical protein [Romboutsia lituseburensis]MCR8745204.1 hypothetical protein [Romboutsia lituseburensis]
MYLNNKGSILLTTLIIFSIIVTITMTCIGLNYSNSNIFTLELKEAQIKQLGYGYIDILNSKLFKEVENALKNTTNEDEFYKYFLENTVKDNICNSYEQSSKSISVKIPNNIKIDKNNKSIKFDINVKVKEKEKAYNKTFKVSVEVINPYNSDLGSLTQIDINKILKLYNYEEIYI